MPRALGQLFMMRQLRRTELQEMSLCTGYRPDSGPPASARSTLPPRACRGMVAFKIIPWVHVEVPINISTILSLYGARLACPQDSTTVIS